MRIFVAAIEQIVGYRLAGEGVTVALVNILGAREKRQCYYEYVKYSFHFIKRIQLANAIEF